MPGQDEFVACLKLLVRDSRLRRALGRNGRDYVAKHYRWDVVLAQYERLFAKVKGQIGVYFSSIVGVGASGPATPGTISRRSRPGGCSPGSPA